MFVLGWGAGWATWVWRRQLWAWEEELMEECQALLHDFVLQAQSPDLWQ
ncbi:receptor-like protein kinase ANXUR2, partial [Trifolium medium]|nr:receptor-like protein kinase ANXUR2 [Trifolium medium]